MIRQDAIYARQSVDKAESISIESQIEFCQYETRGNPCRVYQDKGYSGKNTERPEFQKMLAAVRNCEISRVICYKLDRCSRSILDFANLMEEFQRYGVEFVSCTEKFDTSSPMGRAMLNICIVFAQLERETIQQRVLDAYHARFRRGFFMGGKIPFGFTSEPYYLDGKRTSRYVINEDEAKILEFMYGIYQNSYSSMGDVVNALRDAGIRHPRWPDIMWNRTHIGRMLRNPAYVKADLAVYDFFKEKGVVIHNPPEDFIGTNGCYLYKEKDMTQYLVIAPHQGLISSDIWLRCRAKQKNTDGAVRQNKVKNTWLAGKLKCAKCGYAIVVQKTAKPSGKAFRYLICSRAAQDGSQCNGVHGLKADEVESLIYEQMRRKLEQFPILTARYRNTIDPQITQIKTRIAQLEQEMELAAQKAMEASGILMESLNAKAAALDKQRIRYMEKLRKHESLIPASDSISNYTLKWPELSLEDKMTVCDALIKKIHLSEDTISIEWKI